MESISEEKNRSAKYIRPELRHFRPGTTLEPLTVNLLMDRGGLGDMIARVPAINYFINKNQHITMLLRCPDYFLPLAQIFFGHEPRIHISTIDDYKNEKDWSIPHLDFRHPQYTSYASNLTRHAFNVLTNEEVAPIELAYPFVAEWGSPIIGGDSAYVVITSNYTASVRALTQATFTTLIEHFLDRGIGVTLLGRRHTLVATKRIIESHDLFYAGEHPKLLDLRNSTSLVEAGKVLAGAKCVLGLDNGLLHLAACTRAPIVYGHTTVAPRHRQIIRHGELDYKIERVSPDTSLDCRFCQSNMGYMYGHSFRECFYGDTLCREQLTAPKFIEAYENLLGDWAYA